MSRCGPACGCRSARSWTRSSGAKRDDAYFVNVDATTTTEIDQAAGIVNILVGFAPLRPAEFVVVKLSQKTQPAA